MKFELLFSIAILFIDLSYARNTRLYNSTYAQVGQFPYVGYVFHGSFYCGLSIIHHRWLLTAGHCARNNFRNSKVTVGSNILDSNFKSDGDSYRIEKIYVHHNFEVIPEEENNGLEYVAGDIALIRVDRDIQFSNKVSILPLARDDKANYNGNRVTIAGWGKTQKWPYWSPSSKALKFIEVPIQSNDECRKIWTYITNAYLCTVNALGGICNGDSGSPVVLNGEQIGITSSTDTRCESLKPDLHTRVSSYIPWIEETLKIHGDHL